MAQALHNGFDVKARDATRHFLRAAPGLLDIGDLLSAFDDALARETASGHCFFAMAEDGAVLPLTGDAALIDGVDVARAGGAVLTFPLESADGESLALMIALPEFPDRERQARLHAIAAVYAAHAPALLEAKRESVQPGTLGLLERRCLALATAGWSGLDIGESVDLSPSAVGIYLKRAAFRLGASSITEAGRVAALRNLLN